MGLSVGSVSLSHPTLIRFLSSQMLVPMPVPAHPLPQPLNMYTTPIVELLPQQRAQVMQIITMCPRL